MTDPSMVLRLYEKFEQFQVTVIDHLARIETKVGYLELEVAELKRSFSAAPRPCKHGNGSSRNARYAKGTVVGGVIAGMIGALLVIAKALGLLD